MPTLRGTLAGGSGCRLGCDQYGLSRVDGERLVRALVKLADVVNTSVGMALVTTVLQLATEQTVYRL